MPEQLTRFKVFPQFERDELAGMIRSRHRLGDIAAEVFAGDRVQDRFVRELAARRVLNAKEVLEAFEFHVRVRKRVRRPVMVDLCCGHGLVGVLFALLERSVQRVVLVDRRLPDSLDAVIDAAAAVAPWLPDKLQRLELDLKRVAPHLPDGAGFVAVHACGTRTDDAIALALAKHGPIAVMPCCHRTPSHDGPPAGLKEALGPILALDIDRTYRLHAAGRRVDWTAIPESISPMSRVMIGWLPPELR